MILTNLLLDVKLFFVVLQEIPDPVKYTQQLWDLSPLIGAICTPLIAIIVYLILDIRTKAKKHDEAIERIGKESDERVEDLKDRIEEKDAVLMRVYDERRDDERRTLEVLVNLNALTQQIISSGKEHTERVLDAIRGLDKSVSDFRASISTR